MINILFQQAFLWLIISFAATIITAFFIMPIIADTANSVNGSYAGIAKTIYISSILVNLILYSLTANITIQAATLKPANVSYKPIGQTQVLYDANKGPNEKLTLTYRYVAPKTDLGITGQTLKQRPIDDINNTIIIKRNKNNTTLTAKMAKTDIIESNKKTKTATNPVITRVEITPVKQTERAIIFNKTIASATITNKKVKVTITYQNSKTASLDNAFNN